MNKRIKELWDKAKVNLDEDFSSGRKSISIPKSWDEMMQEKFAELIVEECANELLKWRQEPFPLDADSAARIIKQHFGLK